MKFFTALLVALVAVHASTSSPVVESAGISKTIADILTKVLADTKVLLADAHNWADQLDNNKERTEKDIVDVLTKLVLKLNDQIEALLERVKGNLSEESKAIIGCIEAEKTEINTIVAALLQKVADCEFDNYDAITSVVQKILKQLDQVQTNLETLTANLSDCDGDDVLCITIFLGGVVEQVEGLLPSAREIVTDLRNLVHSLVESGEKCQLIDVVRKDVEQVVNNVATCIKK